MNKVLKEENETRGMERKLSQSEPGEIDPECPTIVKLMDCKEKKSFGHPSEKKKKDLITYKRRKMDFH